MKYNAGSKRLRAVLLSDLSPIIAPMFRAWVEAGNEWVAIMASAPQKRMFRRSYRYEFLAPQWSITRMARKFAPNAPYLFHDKKNNWSYLAEQLADREVDILICAFHLSKIPDTFVRVFPLGCVNLHPSLLPYYPGPQPLQHMIYSGRQAQAGGVTMHVATDRFDDGPIIAQAVYPAAAWQTMNKLSASISGALITLTRDHLPAWCRGELAAVPQRSNGGEKWAGLIPNGFLVDTKWSFEQLEFVAKFLSRRPGLFYHLNGTKVRVGSSIRRLGPASGQAPKTHGSGIEFDIADSRIITNPISPLVRPFIRLVDSVDWCRTMPIPPRVVLRSGENSQ